MRHPKGAERGRERSERARTRSISVRRVREVLPLLRGETVKEIGESSARMFSIRGEAIENKTCAKFLIYIRIAAKLGAV